MSLPTVSQILEALRKRPADIQLKHIAEATGISAGWLSMFRQGRIANPSYETIKTLHEYLNSIKV